MCVYSMFVDRYVDKWTQPPYIQPLTPPVWPAPPNPVIIPYVPMPGRPDYPSEPQKGKPLTQEELDELRDWLERARKYDKETGQRDCESEAKIEKLKKIILDLKPDADLSFLEEEKQ